MFLLNLQSKEPIYEQIQAQILSFIEAGILTPGSRLPSVRQLAQENGINPNTVAKAYSELEKRGYVNNIPKKGVYVADIDADATRRGQLRVLLGSLKQSGVTRAEMLDAVEALYKEEKDAED